MNISRRDFLKGTAAGALGLAASSLIAPAAAFADYSEECVSYGK